MTDDYDGHLFFRGCLNAGPIVLVIWIIAGLALWALL